MAIDYSNCDKKQISLILKERKATDIKELLKRDEEDPCYLIDIEETTYFKDKSHVANIYYLLRHGCFIGEITPALCIQACEALCRYKQGVDLYNLLKKESGDVTVVVLSAFYSSDVILYNKEELLNIIKNKSEKLPQLKERKDKRQLLVSYDKGIEILQIYKSVYDDLTMAFRDNKDWPMLYEEALRMEQSLLCLRALDYGMIIPSWYLAPGLYFRNNISHYLKEKSDMYYFNSIGGLYPYSQGKDVISRYRAMKEDKQGYFIIPFKETKGQNSKTTLWTETNCIDHPLAYYKEGNIWIYEIEELALSFTSAFTMPHNNKSVFTLREINRLEELLVHYFIIPYQPLLKAIQRQKNMLSLLEEEDKESKKKLQTIDMKDMLLSIFECGMYMRRWKGPGHPYPSDSKDTEEKTDNEDIVQQKLKDIKEKKGDLSLLRLKGQGGVLLGISGFEDLYNQVVSGTFCIRVASHYFVTTASYYLLYLYNHKIDKYDYYVDMIV